MYGHIYTQEEQAFFRDYVPGHTYKEIQAAFIAQFGWDISVSQVKGYMGNHKLNNGLNGRFKKGQTPPNKGKKGIQYAGCEKGWFTKGHVPANCRPVGSERISKDGYVEVKVADPAQWKLKHRIVWENAFGKIPTGKVIIFLNGDKKDVMLENLMLIERRVSARMNQSGLNFKDPDSMKAAVNIAQLMAAVGDAKRRKKSKRR